MKNILYTYINFFELPKRPRTLKFAAVGQLIVEIQPDNNTSFQNILCEQFRFHGHHKITLWKYVVKIHKVLNIVSIKNIHLKVSCNCIAIFPIN